MNSLIYFILLTFVYGLYRLGCWYYIRNVKVLRVMFSDYHSIVKYSEVLKNKPLSELPYRSIETNNFSAVFDPTNPLDFFVQIDDIYATINSKYEAIMNWGILIEEEDFSLVDASYKYSLVKEVDGWFVVVNIDDNDNITYSCNDGEDAVIENKKVEM